MEDKEYTLFYYRYTNIQKHKDKSVSSLISFMETISDNGDGLGDCIVDNEGYVVYDFNDDHEFLGIDQPDSRVGELR